MLTTVYDALKISWIVFFLIVIEIPQVFHHLGMELYQGSPTLPLNKSEIDTQLNQMHFWLLLR